MKALFLLSLGLLSFVAWGASNQIESSHECQSTKEFITTKEYFESLIDLSLDVPQVLEVSHEVSKGCTGSAKRFIRAFEVLMKVELGTRNSIRLALELSKRSDAYTDSFLGVFQHAFLKEYLDLDLKTSVELAQSLSIDFKGDVKKGVKDFIQLTQYCMDISKVGLPLIHCAKMAGQVAKSGEKFKAPMAPAFMELYEFLTKEDELKLPVHQAFALAQKTVMLSPSASDNFIAAFRYSIESRGLDRSAKESLIFASQMAERTNFGPPSLIEAYDSQRMPAASKSTATD